MPEDGDTSNYCSPDDLLQAHLPYAAKIARRIASRLPRSVPFDDLNADAVVGLWNASRRYDPTRGTAFTRFAASHIRGAILDGLRRLQWDRQRPRRTRLVRPTFHQVGSGDSLAALPREATLDWQDAIASRLRPIAPRLRMIAILRYVADMRPTEIATALGISGARVTQLHKRMLAGVEACRNSTTFGVIQRSEKSPVKACSP